MKKKYQINKKINLLISGFNFEIVLHTPSDKQLYNNFLKNFNYEYKNFIKDNLKEKADITIEIIDGHFNVLSKKLDQKIYKFIYFYKILSSKKILTFYYISIYQFKEIILNLLQKLTINDGFILHASGNLLEQKVILFTGNSGAGKSTAMKLLRNKFTPLYDDSVIVRYVRNTFWAYQIPIDEKYSFIKKNLDCYEIKYFFFIKKGKKCSIQKIEDKNKIINLFSAQFWSDKKYISKKLEMLIKFVYKNDFFYYFTFPKNKKMMTKFIEQLK